MGGGQEKSEYAQPVDLQEPKPASRSKPRHRERREQRASQPGNFITLSSTSHRIKIVTLFCKIFTWCRTSTMQMYTCIPLEVTHMKICILFKVQRLLRTNMSLVKK